MRRGCLLAFALLGAAARLTSAAEPPRYCGTARWEPLIAEAAQRFSIPAAWVREVMRAESAGCAMIDGRPVVSSAGAIGLMQLMPATWTALRKRHGLGNDPHDPRDNILAGAAYLRELRERFGDAGVFAAYHAGPARYQAHRLRGEPVPVETQRYLARVGTALGVNTTTDATSLAGLHADRSRDDTLFAVDRRASSRWASGMSAAAEARLFAAIRHSLHAADASRHGPPGTPRADP